MDRASSSPGFDELRMRRDIRSRKKKTYSDTPTSGLGRLRTARGVSNSRAVSAPCFRTEYGPWLGYKSARDIGQPHIFYYTYTAILSHLKLFTSQTRNGLWSHSSSARPQRCASARQRPPHRLLRHHARPRRIHGRLHLRLRHWPDF